MTPSFGSRLSHEFAAGRFLCVGIDPHERLLTEWGLENTAAGAEHMARDVIAAAAGVAACIKPQISFFERFGAAGFSALERVLRDARGVGLMTIADAKRGDIGSTFDAYAQAWLAPGSPLEADALTVSSYLGFGAFDGAMRYVRDHGKGVFALAATSNPEARGLQTARQDDGRSVAAVVLDAARAANAELAAEPGEASTVGSVGVVLGATLNLSEFGIDTAAALPTPHTPVLAPGFGHQGARIEDAHEIFGVYGAALLANESRSILGGGSTELFSRIRDRASAIAEALQAS